MIQLRLANNSDIDFFMMVRNDPQVWHGFYTQKKPLTVKEHYKWWYSRNQDWERYVIVVDGDDAGILNLGQLDHWSPEIGYALMWEYWGKGYGTEAVKMALESLKNRGYKHCHTTVLKSNMRSQNLLKSLGFTVLGDAREGEDWLVKTL